jgi:phospholipid/cholesterol/gamma-HCH transport system substrate-binding protein
MENRAYALGVGLFVLLLSAGIVFVAMWFSGDTEKRDAYFLESRYPVTGLNLQAPVRFRGVEVGRVESIAFDGGPGRPIVVGISVKSGTPITRGTWAQLGSQGVTGLAYVILDDEGDKPELLAAGRTDARIPVRQSFLDDLASSSKGLVADAGQAVQRINALLSEPNQAQLIKTLSSLEEETVRFGAMALKLDPTLKNLPGLTEEARKAFVSVNQLATEFTRRVDALERVARSAEQVGGATQSVSDVAVADTLPRINALIEELSRNSRSLDRLITELNEQPSSLVFGRPPVEPGPGEPGFVPHAGGAK